MEAQSAKYTNEALAFMTLYKTMAPEVQKEVKALIETENEEDTDLLTAISFEAWDIENDKSEEESAIWEKFLNEQKGV
ncbi:MAG: hypothetical protein EOP44_02520 [Sphingobacteriaceae bacterium]|nr:MAG: hypothetical protein EOP44_02520 [Sphingobacteriaceae bacterium]